MKDRRPNSIGIRLHWWRGIEWESGLLIARVTFGFVTLFADDVDMIFRLNALKDQLEKLAGRKP